MKMRGIIRWMKHNIRDQFPERPQCIAAAELHAHEPLPTRRATADESELLSYTQPWALAMAETRGCRPLGSVSVMVVMVMVAVVVVVLGMAVCVCWWWCL